MNKKELTAAIMPMIRREVGFVVLPVPGDFVPYNRKLTAMKTHIRKMFATHGINKEKYAFSDPDLFRADYLTFVVGYC